MNPSIQGTTIDKTRLAWDIIFLAAVMRHSSALSLGSMMSIKSISMKSAVGSSYLHKNDQYLSHTTSTAVA
jgi:hypothetical protein